MAALVELVILVLAIAMAIQSIGYLTTPIVTSPGILPLIVSISMALISGALLVAALVEGDASVSRLKTCFGSPAFRARAAKAAGWLTLATLYAIATPVVGFVWATLAFLAIALTAFARLAWWKTAVIAGAIATLIPVAFRFLFHTIVP
jgi:hypothetical protein